MQTFLRKTTTAVLAAAALGAVATTPASAADPAGQPCVRLPAKANVGSLVGLVPIAVQDIPILSAPQNQQCTSNDAADEPLPQILDDIPVLSGNGEHNG